MLKTLNNFEKFDLLKCLENDVFDVFQINHFEDTFLFYPKNIKKEDREKPEFELILTRCDIFENSFKVEFEINVISTELNCPLKVLKTVIKYDEQFDILEKLDFKSWYVKELSNEDSDFSDDESKRKFDVKFDLVIDNIIKALSEKFNYPLNIVEDSFFGYEEIMMVNYETDEVLIHFEWTYPYDVNIPSSQAHFELSVTFLLYNNVYYKFIFNPITLDEFILSDDYVEKNMENLNEEISDFKDIYEKSALLNQLKELDNVTYTFSKEFGCSDILICCLNNTEIANGTLNYDMTYEFKIDLISGHFSFSLYKP